MREHIVLIGPMGSGKSSIGRKLAKELGVSFVDSDARIQAQHGQITQIFSEQGEAGFRRIESETIASLLAEPPTVLALGGGAVLSTNTQQLIKDKLVVELTVRESQIAARILGSARPLLNESDDPVARWREIYEQRRALYRALSDVSFDTGAGSFEDVVAAIAKWLRAQDRLGLGQGNNEEVRDA